MRGRERRRFTLADIMVLVAATAGGLGLTRYLNNAGNVNPGNVAAPQLPGGWINHLSYGKPAHMAIALAAALIVLRWLPPRPSMARLARQPGFVACLATLGGLALGTAQSLLLIALRKASPIGANDGSVGLNVSLNSGILMISSVVAGAWLALALGGRWTPEKSWIDRAGRCVGFFWVAAFPLMFFRSLITYLVPYVRFLD